MYSRSRFLLLVLVSILSAFPVRAAISPEADALFASLKTQIDALRTALGTATGTPAIDPAVLDALTAKLDATRAALTGELAQVKTTLAGMSNLATWNASQLPEVTNFSVKLGSSGSVLTVTWDYYVPVDMFSGFQIERSENGGNDWPPIASPAREMREYQVEGVQPGKSYLYRIRAYAHVLPKVGSPSNVISFTGGTTP